MLVPLSWLREFVPYEGTPQALGDMLTMRGLELEGIIHPFANIAEIKVGFVAQCFPHPDSDHLHCCKVDVDSGELLDIVCGAPNVAEGQKVAVACVGSRLPDGTTIKKAKLRGQPSCGMICSERELGLSDDHSGIMVLPDSVIVGHRLIDALDLERDVLDISVTPNRADCLSILGVARETALDFGLPLELTDLPLIYADGAAEPPLPVTIDNPELCWLYSGRVVRGISVAPSPLRLRCRLLAAGQRAVSNIVDITNYILFECGQPLHAFDLDKLAGTQIAVRLARSGEELVTLDGRKRDLQETDLCICDAAGPVGLAGVMGGLNTEITAASQNIFLESAVFQPRSIRKTARRLGISSEASFRFERGVDQRRAIWALDRACAMIASLAQGQPSRQFSCSEPRPFLAASIPYRPARADMLLGTSLAEDFQVATLEAVGCSVERSESGAWTVSQPSWRPDLTREADLIEEVGRVYGLDGIEPQLPCVARKLAGPHGETRFGFLAKAREWAAGIGLHEAINYSFVGEKELDALHLPLQPRISIFNPLSEDQNTLRTSLAPGLLQDLANNLAFGVQNVRLFEIANTFHASASAETSVEEVPVMGLLLYGERSSGGWPRLPGNLDYSDIKGLVENFFRFLRIGRVSAELANAHAFLAPCVNIAADAENLGFMGRIKPDIAKIYNAQKDVWLCELNLELLQKLHAAAQVRFCELPSYPPVRRDMTVMAASNVTADMILENILARKIPLLEGAELIDCYGEGARRHLTFRLTFRHARRTLKDQEADREREKIAEFLRQKLAVEI